MKTTELLNHIPDRTQRVLGKEDLHSIDLWELAKAEGHRMHRVTYLNIPVPESMIKRLIETKYTLTLPW